MNLLDDLARSVPPQRLLTGSAQRAAFASDALTSFRADPAAVVLAESADEVVAVVRVCHRAQRAVRRRAAAARRCPAARCRSRAAS